MTTRQKVQDWVSEYVDLHHIENAVTSQVYNSRVIRLLCSFFFHLCFMFEFVRLLMLQEKPFLWDILSR